MKAEARPVSSRDITITMTEEEAGVLLEACSKIGGDPSGKRGVWDRLAAALRAVNVSKAVSTFHTGSDGFYYRP